MSIAETIISSLRGRREPRGTIHVVDRSPLNWFYITYNTVEELVRADENGHIIPAEYERSIRGSRKGKTRWA